MNALLAPIIFSTPVEYPIVIIAACLALPVAERKAWSKPWLTFAFPVALVLLTLGLSLLVPKLFVNQRLRDGLVLCLPLLLCYLAASRKRFIFALSLLAVIIGGYRYLNANENALTTERNFFGVWRVSHDKNGSFPFRRLEHGSTTHGWQFTDPAKKCQATAYYHKDGPLGQIFGIFDEKSRPKNVGAIGLGAGTMATYSAPGQQWDFYEIDPAILRIATDARNFTFLSDCAASPYRMVLGDARLRLREAQANEYGLLLLDAFSSDSVPAHLVTSQALDLYLSKLTADGVVAFHISNRYLNLEPLLSGLSKRAGLASLIRADNMFDLAIGKYPSTWVVIARNDAALGGLVNDARWRRLQGNVVWTDDFSNVFGLMK